MVSRQVYRKTFDLTFYVPAIYLWIFFNDAASTLLYFPIMFLIKYSFTINKLNKVPVIDTTVIID